MKYKRGMIIVRISRDSGSSANLNYMHKISGEQNGFIMSNGWAMRRDHARLATDIEIKAYNSGIRFIKNIPKTVDNFSII